LKLAVLVVGLLLTTTGFLTLVLPGRLRAILSWFAARNRMGLAVRSAAVPALGEERVDVIVTWWLARADSSLRAWNAMVTATGGFIPWLAA
jgi:hypothetical protein